MKKLFYILLIPLIVTVIVLAQPGGGPIFVPPNAIPSGGFVGFGNFNTSQFGTNGGTVSITNGVLLTNATHYGVVNVTNTSGATTGFIIATDTGNNALSLLKEGGADKWRFGLEGSDDKFYFRDGNLDANLTIDQSGIVEIPSGRLDAHAGITNRSWYHGTGNWTNAMSARLKRADGDLFLYFDTAAGDYGSGVTWARDGTVEKWKLANRDGSLDDDLRLHNQTGLPVIIFQTNGTVQVTNQLSVGSYSYTISTNLTTPGNTPTVIFSAPVPADKSIAIEVVAVAKQASSANGGLYHYEAAGSNNGGTTAIIGTATEISQKETIAGTVAITFDNTTDAGLITITGVAATSITWGLSIKVTVTP